MGVAVADSLTEVMTGAWRHALQLGSAAPELSMSWEAAGGDSLAMLQLLLELETRLDRKIDFTLLEPDMDIAAMVRRLAIDEVAAVTGRPTIHLLPGQYGDGPSLARFRSWFGDRLRLQLVDLPDLEASPAVLSDLVATARHAADTIASRQPDGPVHLAGYSFGGSVAFEAARLLAERGRQIAFVGILDAAFGAAVHGTSMAASFQSPRRWQAHRLAVLALTPRAMRRAAIGLADAVSPVRGIAARHFIARQFRADARHSWRPETAPWPGLIVVSAEFEAQTLAIWRQLLPEAQIIKLPGLHADLFRGPGLDTLGTAFEAALP